MRTTNNNFTVENLVVKYRNYVKEHCAKYPHIDGNILDIPSSNADEQLLVTLYKEVVGNNADEKIVEALSKYADAFMEEALTKEEWTFLCANFQETVKYEFSHRQDWIWQHNLTEKHYETRAKLALEYIKSPKDLKVFIAGTGYCDLAVRFPDCVIMGFAGQSCTNEDWAMGQIRMIAAGMESDIVLGEMVAGDYVYSLPQKNSVDVVLCGVDMYIYSSDRIGELFDILKPGGRMLFFSDMKNEMAGKTKASNIYEFRKRMVGEKTISSIVQFEEDSTFLSHKVKNILLVIDKKENNKVLVVDECKDKSVTVKAENICADILWPSYYMTAKPTTGIPLSSLVTLASDDDKDNLATFKDGEFILSEQVKERLVVEPFSFGMEYKDANLRTKELLPASDAIYDDWKCWLRDVKEPCVFLFGSQEKYVVGYIANNLEKKFVRIKSVPNLIPNKGIDARYIAALLFVPEVKQQIIGFCDGDFHTTSLASVLDKIIVPNHDEKERLHFLSEANYEALEESQQEMKQNYENYKKSVRMRKHALTQSLSSIEALFYALNAYRIRQRGDISDNGKITPIRETTVKDAFERISKEIRDVMPAIEHIADIEYSFSKPEWINPESFIEEYIDRLSPEWLNFKASMLWEKNANIAKIDIENPVTKEHILHKGEPLCQFYFSNDALETILNNIVANAKSYAFTENDRSDYRLRFSWHSNGMALIIEVENNGTPIPKDIDTNSLLEYGVSSALHNDGHNGIGCCEIRDLMQRYNGNVQIISSPNDEYTVKYVLTFNNTNLIRTL